MKFVSNKIRLQYNSNHSPELVFTLEGNTRPNIDDLTRIVDSGKKLTIEAKQYRNSRSLDANSYLWVLCQKIAEVIHITKEDVYKKAIREVGQFQILPFHKSAVDRWVEIWNSKGLGWFAEVMSDSKIPEFKNIITYYGSSVYDTREMALLIDNIVQECNQLGIETMPQNELESLKNSWR